MCWEFALILTDSELTDEQCNALYEVELDDGTISTSDQISRIDVGRDADSIEDAIRSAIGQVQAAGLSVARIEIEAEQFVGTR